MQRLVKVTDKMHQELERLGTLLARKRPILQRGFRPRDRRNHAIPFGRRLAIAARVVVGFAFRDVHEVPVRGFRALGPNLVGEVRY